MAFYWLPCARRGGASRGRRRPPQPPPAAEPARPVLSAEEQAALKKQAEDLLAGLLTLQDELTRSERGEVGQPKTGNATRQLSEAGDNAFLADDFATLPSRATPTRRRSATRSSRAPLRTSSDRSTPAEAALAAGNAELAIEQYDLVLTIEPTHAAALAQRARAERLPEVLALVQRADVRARARRARRRRSRATARRSRSIADWAPATRRRRRRQPRAARRRVRAAVVGGVRPARRRETSRTRKTRVRGGARRSTRLARSARRARAGRGGREARSDRAGGGAGARVRAARAVGPSDRAVSLGARVRRDVVVRADGARARASPRAGLDAKLANLIDNPTLLLGDAVLADARKLLDAAGAEEPTAVRASRRRSSSSAGSSTLASQPVAVRLTSDQLTTRDAVSRRHARCIRVARTSSCGPALTRSSAAATAIATCARRSRCGPGGNLPPISVVCVEPI